MPIPFVSGDKQDTTPSAEMYGAGVPDAPWPHERKPNAATRAIAEAEARHRADAEAKKAAFKAELERLVDGVQRGAGMSGARMPLESPGKPVDGGKA